MTNNKKIMYDYNAKDCEQCSPDSVCCYCKNLICYQLEEQLKAKEQECEKLKEELNGIEKLCRTNAEKFIDKYDQLKAENEELKKQLESTKGLVTVGNRQLAEALKGYEELTSKCSQQEEEIKDLTAKNNEYIDANHELVVQVKILKSNRLNMFEHLDIVQENNKLKQTLEEIREIVYQDCNECGSYDDGIGQTYEKCDDCKYGEILQKINECEVK